MSRSRSYTLIASPCCGSLYKIKASAPRHYSATGYWTDGAEEDGLVSTDGGLRVCRCGTAFLIRDAASVGLNAGPEITFPTAPNEAQLPDIIDSASSPSLEVTARRNYWRHLNDGYRVEYRAFREKEDAISTAHWCRDYYASLPLLRRLVCKLLNIKPKWDFPKPSRPFNVPPYQPTNEQAENMARLLALILSAADQTGKADQIEVAELYRELGQFEAAAEAVRSCKADHDQVARQVMGEHIGRRCAAPIRYRI